MSSIRIAQESARGTFILFVGNVLYTGVLAVATILIARLLGPDGYGAYTLTFVFPGLLTLFVGFGINTAITRYIALHISRGEAEKASRVTGAATAFLFLFGAALSAVNFLGAPLFVTVILHRPELVSYSEVASLWVLGVALTQVVQSAFVGWVLMAEASTFNVLLAVIKLIVSVGLIVAGFGVYGAVLGHVAAYVIDGVVGVAVLFFMKMRSRGNNSGWVFGEIGGMLRYGLPLFGAQIALGLAGQYATVVLATIASNAVVGYYASAGNITVAFTVMSGALSLSLFRSFAALEGLRENLSLAFTYSVKYSSYVLTPVAFFLLASARPLVDLLYGASYAPTVLLLEIAAASFLPVSIGWLVLPSFFNGIGTSRLTLLISAVAAVTFAAGAYLLGAVLGLGAEGVMIASLCSNVSMTVSGLLISNRVLRIRPPMAPLLSIFLAGSVAGLGVRILPTGGLLSIESLALDSIVFLILYAVLVPFFLGVDDDDLVRLSIAVGTMGPLRKLFEGFLGFERRILSIRKRAES